MGSAPAEEEEPTADHPRALFPQDDGDLEPVRPQSSVCAQIPHISTRERLPSKTSQSQSFPPRTVTRRKENLPGVDNGECSRGARPMEIGRGDDRQRTLSRPDRRHPAPKPKRSNKTRTSPSGRDDPQLQKRELPERQTLRLLAHSVLRSSHKM